MLALQHFRSLTTAGCDGQHGELSEINNVMAKVFCVSLFGLLIVEHDIQVDVTLITFGDLELYAWLCLFIF